VKINNEIGHYFIDRKEVYEGDRKKGRRSVGRGLGETKSVGPKMLFCLASPPPREPNPFVFSSYPCHPSTTCQQQAAPLTSQIHTFRTQNTSTVRYFGSESITLSEELGEIHGIRIFQMYLGLKCESVITYYGVDSFLGECVAHTLLFGFACGCGSLGTGRLICGVLLFSFSKVLGFQLS
jgi:hypothetical protein